MMKLIVSALPLLALATRLHAANQKPVTEEKPNIIFILADDLSYWDIGHFGQKHFSTPNIDRLAKEGRVFANAYAGGPWCSPSRTALLTGMKCDLSSKHPDVCTRARAKFEKIKTP